MPQTSSCDGIFYQPDAGHLAKNVVEVGDEDDNEGEAAKDMEEAANISGTWGAHQIPGKLMQKISVT